MEISTPCFAGSIDTFWGAMSFKGKNLQCPGSLFSGGFPENNEIRKMSKIIISYHISYVKYFYKILYVNVRLPQAFRRPVLDEAQAHALSPCSAILKNLLPILCRGIPGQKTVL